jgi:hypothetical protein
VRLQQTGAIRQINVNVARYCSASFVIPKKVLGKFRLIIDLRPLNQHCIDLPVKYDNIKDVKNLFSANRPVRFFGSIDISDGYHHFGIAPEY